MRLKTGLILVPGPPLHLRGGEREISLFDGPTEAWLPDLLRALDGRDRDAVARALPRIDPADIDRTIEKLRSAGVLEDDAPPPRRPRIALVGGSPLWDLVRPLLAADFGDAGEIAVAHEEFLAPSELAALNRRHLDARAPWLLLSVQGAWGRVGPLFVPGETACWECYRARLASNRSHPDAHAAWEAMDAAPRHRGAPPHEAAVAALAAAEISRFLFRHAPPQLAGRVLVVDLDRLDGAVEPVPIAPYCPACRPSVRRST